MAQPLERTLRVSLFPAEATGVHHADMADRIVKADGIIRIDLAERRCDVGRHLPSRARVTRQAQAASEPDEMCIEWNDEPRGGDSRPHSQIDLVAPDHPAEEQVQALARA